MCGFNNVAVILVSAEATSPHDPLCATPQQKDQEQNRNRNSEKPKQNVSSCTGFFDFWTKKLAMIDELELH
jgi:hypothetical protein